MPRKRWTCFAQSCLLVLALAGFAGAAQAPARPPLADRHQAQGLACRDCHGEGPKKTVAKDACLGCHESYAKLAERTRRLKPNPHDNHLVDLSCGKCHKGHKPQENYCQTCHAELEFTESR